MKIIHSYKKSEVNKLSNEKLSLNQSNTSNCWSINSVY